MRKTLVFERLVKSKNPAVQAVGDVEIAVRVESESRRQAKSLVCQPVRVVAPRIHHRVKQVRLADD